MISLHEVLDVDRPQGEVFAYVADFANVAEWDPGVTESTRLDDGPLGVGARYQVKVKLGPTTGTMTYEVTEWHPDERVVLKGEGSGLTAIDDISFAATDSGGTRIVYKADFTLPWFARLAEPLVRKGFERAGREAMAGLAKTLS